MSKLTPAEKVVDNSLVQAVAGEFPVLGGLASFWRDKIAERRAREVDQSLAEIEDDIQHIYAAMQNKVDVGHLKSTDFQETLASLVEQCVRDADERKREYLKKFVVNYALSQRPDKVYKDMFLQTIREVGSLHITVLTQLYAEQKTLSEQDLEVVLTQPNRSAAITIGMLSQRMHTDKALLRAVVLQAVSRSLIQTSEPTWAAVTDKSVIVLTSIGKAFVSFLAGEWSGIAS
ncbi:MAG: hypothetical protein A2Y77_09965 [Planctomycetes bacterium RBG_13_62_9]|nr:MAG: hypothetical protein A2Y77_09965 [Planctomycetes bacterium RBG_13_62_9]